ncbi:hypothetical protein CXF85_02415 [Colwellia sp. 75C3]|uniref:hypothetical protein n=1 Tax=Colwellia sp. 75C3 TaxID=888425 RepID=UPI000CC17184|nr:hypothetical protein [Colwellia sp. 75C3]PKG85667.1 hypothetical protein CXF85_02415 [Colwellia sp. 75C3]
MVTCDVAIYQNKKPKSTLIMQKTKNNLLKLILFCSLYICSSTFVAVGQTIEIEWLHDVDMSFGFNNNQGQAQKDRDIIEDKFIELNYSLIFNIDINDDSAISLKGFLEARKQNVLDDLSRTTYGAQFIYRWQSTRGFFEPFYQFNISIQDDTYGVVQRDSTVIESQFFATKRLTDAFTLVAGIKYWSQDSDGTVFDLYRNEGFVNLDYRHNARYLWYMTYGYRKGEIWSTSQAVFCNGAIADDIFPLINWSLEMETDHAFNNALCGDWIAYKLKADTHTLTLGLNVAVGESSAFDFSVFHIDSTAEANISYQSTIFRASYLVRF